MNVNNLTTLIISLMVCGLVVGATIPMITAISSETTIEEYNSTDDASWIRMAYGTADYDLEYTLADDTITVGTQSGTADDMILYADEKSCVMSFDGEFVIVNGYIENPEVIKADTVTVTRSAGAITITDGTDTIVSADAPAWAYYPKADGTYSFFDASVEGVKVKPTENLASVGSFAGVMAYNNIVVAPNNAGDLGLSLDTVIDEDVITSVKWLLLDGAESKVKTEYGTPNIADWSYSASSSDKCRVIDYTGTPTDLVIVPNQGYNNNNQLVPVSSVGYTSNVMTNADLMANAELILPTSTINMLIGGSAFDGCSNFSGALCLPEKITTIGAYAFKDCSGFDGTLILPSTVTTVSNYAFQNCTGLDSVIILSSPTYSNFPFSGTNIKQVLNLGGGDYTYSDLEDVQDKRSDIPAFGYIAPLSNTVIVQKEGAIFDVLSLLPLVAGIGLLMVAVIYALERRYV